MALDPALGIPVAMVVRLATIVMTLALARRPRAARPVAFVGSLLASLITGIAAGAVLAGGSPPHGTLFVHDARASRSAYAVDGLVGVVPARPGRPRRAHRRLQHRLRRPSRATPAIRFRRRRRSTSCSARSRLVFVGGRRIAFLFAWELMTLATAALRGDRARSARQPPRRLPLPGDVARRHRLPDRRVPVLALARRLARRSRPCCRAASVSGPMRDVLFALFLVGFGVKAGHHPAARLAARGAPGGAEQHLGADVGRADQDRHLRHRARLRVRSRRAAACRGA